MKRHLILIPERAEKEVGFGLWVNRVWKVVENTGAKALFYGSVAALEQVKEVLGKRTGEVEYIEFCDWDDFLIVFRDVRADDLLWVVMSRGGLLSYNNGMSRIPGYLNKYFFANSFILVYPLQAKDTGNRYLV